MKKQFDRRGIISSLAIALVIIITLIIVHTSKKDHFAQQINLPATSIDYVAHTEMEYTSIPRANVPVMAAGSLKIIESLTDAISTMQFEGRNSFTLTIFGLGTYSISFHEKNNDLIREYKVTIVTHDKADEEPKVKELTIQEYGSHHLTRISFTTQIPNTSTPLGIIWEQDHSINNATLTLNFKEGTTNLGGVSGGLAWDMLFKNIARTRSIFAFFCPIEKELLGQRN